MIGLVKRISKMIFLFLVLASCSNLSKNLISTGEFSITGGYFSGEQKTEALHFKKYAWIKEASILYIASIAKLDAQSSYNKWLSKNRRSDIKRECTEFYIGLFYSNRSTFIHHNDVMDRLESQGIEEYVLPDFHQNLRINPIYEERNLKLYRLRGLCIKGIRNKPIIIDLPGYSAIEII